MGAGAKIGEFALLVKGNLLALGELVYKLGLIGFILHKLQSFGARKNEAFDLEIFLYDLLHFLFDRFERFGSENDRAVHIVIKAVFDRRSDRQFCFRVKTLYRLRENVRRGMAYRLKLVCFVNIHSGSSFLGFRFDNKIYNKLILFVCQ